MAYAPIRWDNVNSPASAAASNNAMNSGVNTLSNAFSDFTEDLGITPEQIQAEEAHTLQMQVDGLKQKQLAFEVATQEEDRERQYALDYGRLQAYGMGQEGKGGGSRAGTATERKAEAQMAIDAARREATDENGVLNQEAFQGYLGQLRDADYLIPDDMVLKSQESGRKMAGNPEPIQAAKEKATAVRAANKAGMNLVRKQLVGNDNLDVDDAWLDTAAGLEFMKVLDKYNDEGLVSGTEIKKKFLESYDPSPVTFMGFGSTEQPNLQRTIKGLDDLILQKGIDAGTIAPQ